VATVIDALLVTLGLDAKGFKEGAAEAERAQEKLKASAQAGGAAVGKANTAAGVTTQKLGKARKLEAEAEEKRRKQAETLEKQQHADSMKRVNESVGKLKEIGMVAFGALLGFESLKGAFVAYGDATSKMAAAGRFATTVDTDVHALNTLSNALQQVGGTAEDANADLAKLAHAQVSIQMHSPDALAGYARRMGVNLFDQRGNPRDKLDILKDIGARLRQMTSDVQVQATYAREMGLSEAAIQLYVVKQADERERILKLAEASNRLSKDDANNAQKVVAAYSTLKSTISGIVNHEIWGKANQSLAISLPKMTDAIQKNGFWKGLVKGYTSLDFAPGSPEAQARGLRNNNPGNLRYKGQAGASNAGGFAQFKSMADGIRAASKQIDLYMKRGLNTISKIISTYAPSSENDTDAYIKDVSKRLGKSADAPLTDNDKAQLLAAIFAHESGKGAPNQAAVNAAMSSNGGAAGAAAFSAAVAAPGPRPGQSPPTAMNGGGQNVQIDEINIVTQATDATGIASTIAPAIQRKGVVAQANSGLS
jgi:hypothetical protein